MKSVFRWVSLITLTAWTGPLLAQGFEQPPTGLGPPRAPQAETPAGPAEAAPQVDDAVPELPPLPAWPGLERKRLQFLQLDGYFRIRPVLYSGLSLGWPNTTQYPAPFPTRISERSGSPASCAARTTGDPTAQDVGGCPDDTLAGATMRLRLAPTINVSDTVRVHAQVDVFDNLMMGSTPNSFSGLGATSDRPLDMLSDSQAPVLVGVNSNVPSILVKRAWAEIVTPLGLLEAGRMGWHWGLGLRSNDGECWDCDFGTNHDRIMFRSHTLWQHTFGVGYNFTASGPSTMTVAGATNSYSNRAIDLEELDDVDEWFWIIARQDDQHVIADRVLRGEVVINYGLYLAYRTQSYGYADGVGLGSTEDALARSLVKRNGWTLSPDIWFKLRYKHLAIDLQGVFIGGQIDNVAQTEAAAAMTVSQFGWVARGQYGFLRDKLKVKLELGMASGDENEPENQDVNRRRFNVLRNQTTSDVSRNDTSLTEFRFNDDYLVDLILFRDVLGTVANAMYIKPSVSYDIFESLGAHLDLIYSMAHKPVAFPGNAVPIGLELDIGLLYRNRADGFGLGIQYGVLFPFGALNRPLTLDGESFFPPGIAADAGIAQTVRAHLIVNF